VYVVSLVALAILKAEKDLTLHKRLQQIANSVAVAGTLIEQAFDLGSVGKSHRSAGGVNSELVQQVACKLSRVVSEQSFQVVDVLKLATIAELAAGVNG
jgi:hypothetical protein